MKAMKRVKSKRQQQQKASAPTELSSFSLAAAISEASETKSSSASLQPPQPQPQPQPQPPQQPRKIFGNLASPLRKSSASQQSLATNTSFATANESAPINESITPAASYFVDSSDDETNDEGLAYNNDPLAVLSRTAATTSADKPTEISFSNISPEEAMPSKKSSKAKIVPVADEAAPIVPAPVEPVAPTEAPLATKPAPAEEEAHFDVAQNVYGAGKDVWAWGKTVPVITNLLGLTEAVAAKVLGATVHMDLPAIDEQAVKPNLKKLDDDIITPVVLAVWKIIEPAIVKSEEMIVKPVMKEVVPRVLAPLAMFDKKKEEEKKAVIEPSPAPAVVPALN